MSSGDTDSPADTEARLRDLIDRGYQFIHPRDGGGGVIAVVGVRLHDNVIDVVRLNAEDDVVATRMPGDEADILRPRTVLWRITGDATEVLDELLELPDDRTPGSVLTPGQEPGKGCRAPGGDGTTSKWMQASA